jgi:hypothetical protein
LKEKLLTWKQLRIYVIIMKLRMKIMQEEHDVPTTGQHGENGSNEMITITFDLAKLFFWHVG